MHKVLARDKAFIDADKKTLGMILGAEATVSIHIIPRLDQLVDRPGTDAPARVQSFDSLFYSVVDMPNKYAESGDFD